jgi:hypothetical protein
MRHAGRIPARRRCRCRSRGRIGCHAGGRLKRLVRRRGGEPNELARRLELLVLRAQPLELEPEQRTRGLRQAVIVEVVVIPTPPAHEMRERPAGDIAEDVGERVRDVGRHPPSEPAAGGRECAAEELLELVLP